MSEEKEKHSEFILKRLKEIEEETEEIQKMIDKLDIHKKE